MSGFFASILAPDRTPEKAATGPGVTALSYEIPLWTTLRDPRAMMRQAQATYHTNAWIHAAESAVSSRFATLGWHLEDADDALIDDDEGGPEAARAAFRWLDRPQAELAGNRKRMTRRELWQITCRHAGLCGTSFWLLDQRDLLAGTPLATVYLNPARMTPAETKEGVLVGWVLDADDRGNGTPLQLDEVAQFVLDPPDVGHYGIGLVEAAARKAKLNELVDTHVGGVISSGGRLAGLIGPKVGGSIPDDKFEQLVRDLRTITESPDAAKRTIALQGPVDFQQTSADPHDLGTLELSKLTRDDTLALWGVPYSIVGGQPATGLNSGESRKFDEAAFMQGPVHHRVVMFAETLQITLDRWKLLRAPVTLIIEEPEFDDDGPRFDLLAKSESVTMTNEERRALVGLEPFGDKVTDEQGRIIDKLVMLPAGQLDTFYAIEGAPIVPPPPQPPVPPAGPDAFGTAPAQPGQLPTGDAGPGIGTIPGAPGKARAQLRPLERIRSHVQDRVRPRLERSLAAFLEAQRAEIVRRIRDNAAHVMTRPADASAWWNPGQWDRRLAAAVQPHRSAIAELVAGQTHATLAARLGPARATKAAPALDPFLEAVTSRVIRKGGARIRGINEATRQRVAVVIADAVAAGGGDAVIGDVIGAVEAMPWFDELRAETIARTESAQALNDAALDSYAELGVERVQAIDGDGDPECAERDGQTFTVEEAAGIEDHPNGTLDWVPLVD